MQATMQCVQMQGNVCMHVGRRCLMYQGSLVMQGSHADVQVHAQMQKYMQVPHSNNLSATMTLHEDSQTADRNSCGTRGSGSGSGSILPRKAKVACNTYNFAIQELLGQCHASIDSMWFRRMSNQTCAWHAMQRPGRQT